MTCSTYVPLSPMYILRRSCRHKHGYDTDSTSVQLYAYAKVAQGEDIEKAAKPGMMDFTVRISPPASLRSLTVSCFELQPTTANKSRISRERNKALTNLFVYRARPSASDGRRLSTRASRKTTPRRSTLRWASPSLASTARKRHTTSTKVHAWVDHDEVLDNMAYPLTGTCIIIEMVLIRCLTTIPMSCKMLSDM
jgi:hypothetical protein